MLFADLSSTDKKAQNCKKICCLSPFWLQNYLLHLSALLFHRHPHLPEALSIFPPSFYLVLHNWYSRLDLSCPENISFCFSCSFHLRGLSSLNCVACQQFPLSPSVAAGVDSPWIMKVLWSQVRQTFRQGN